MKIMISAGLLVMIGLFIAQSATAQSAISDEKRSLIGELITLINLEKDMLDITDLMLAEMEKVYPASFGMVVDARDDLNAKQKADLKATSTQSFITFSKKFRSKISQSVDFKEYIDVAIYPLYDKTFTADELKDLIAFYRTPTGKKVIQTLPQLMADSQESARVNLLPKVLPILEELLDEEFGRAGGLPAGKKAEPPPPAKPPKN